MKRLMKILLGLSIGAALALLFAPKSGRKLREQLIGGATGKLLPAAPVEFPEPESERIWDAGAATAVEEPPVAEPAIVAEVVATEPEVAGDATSEDLRVRIEETRAAVESDIAHPFAPVVVEEPVVEEPVAEEPVVEEPVAEVVEEPAAEVVEEPVVEEPAAEEPVVEEPVVEEPVAEEPVVEEPAGGGRRGAGQPRSPSSRSRWPEVVEEPVAGGRRGARRRRAEVVEEPVVEEPVAEEPVVEEPVAEVVEEPVVEEPVVEEPVVDGARGARR